MASLIFLLLPAQVIWGVIGKTLHFELNSKPDSLFALFYAYIFTKTICTRESSGCVVVTPAAGTFYNGAVQVVALFFTSFVISGYYCIQTSVLYFCRDAIRHCCNTLCQCSLYFFAGFTFQVQEKKSIQYHF